MSAELIKLPERTKVQVSATLKNAERITEERAGKTVTTNLRGQIYLDTKGRFEDGAWVITSRIKEELPGSIFKTTNSYYFVEFAEPVAAAAKEAA